MHSDGDSGLDADVFEAIRVGDGRGQGLLFRRYERMVRRLLVRQLGGRNDVDDLVSEVFVRFFEGATRVRSAPGLRNYLYAIALYTAREEMRQRERERRAFSGFASGHPGEAGSSDDPRARAALRELEAILLGMRASDRLAYVLRQMVGLSLPEVARALGTSLSTAQRRVRSARRFVEKRAARSALLADYIAAGAAVGTRAGAGAGVTG